MTELPRTQHILASGLIAAVGISVAYISFTQEPAAAFVFPRLISSVFAVLAIWTFGKAILGRTKVGNGISADAMMKMLPGLIVALIYIFVAAKGSLFKLPVFGFPSSGRRITGADDTASSSLLLARGDSTILLSTGWTA